MGTAPSKVDDSVNPRNNTLDHIPEIRFEEEETEGGEECELMEEREERGEREEEILVAEAEPEAEPEVGPEAEPEAEPQMEVISGRGINLATLEPEPVAEEQLYCCLTYAPHLQSRSVFVTVNGCFPTADQANEFSGILHRHDPRFNRYVGECGRPLPIPLDPRLFTDNPVLIGDNPPQVPFNVISETVPDSDLDVSESESDISDSYIISDSETDSFESCSSTCDLVSVEAEDSGEDNSCTSCNSTSNSPSYSLRRSGASQSSSSSSSSSTNNSLRLRCSGASQSSSSSSNTDSNENYFSCITCLSTERNALLMPCRHVPYCIKCAHIHTRHSANCPICRGAIKEVMNIFL